MDPLIILLILIFVFGMAFLYLQVRSLKKNTNNPQDAVLLEWLKTMKSEVSTSIDKNSEILERQLKEQRQAMQEQTKTVWQRLDNAQEVIRNVQKQLGGIEEFGKDIKDLSNVLKSPKLRGGAGEQFLYEILANSLPKDLFATQYKFKDGSICDAVIFFEKGIIPIDAKFSLENYKASITAATPEERERLKKLFYSDVKKRIDEVSSKYIIPAEGTIDQAIMYIPSETTFHEIMTSTEMETYARNKSVLIASPHTLWSYLKVLLAAYKHKSLEKHAAEILKALGTIKIEAEKFNEDLGVLERHISNSYKAMDSIKIRFQRLFTRIENTQLLDAPKEVEEKQAKLLE